jgi:hypothetical protein
MYLTQKNVQGSIHTSLSCSFFVSQYETKDLSSVFFPFLSLYVIASSFNYLAYCSPIAPPCVCY